MLPQLGAPLQRACLHVGAVNWSGPIVSNNAVCPAQNFNNYRPYVCASHAKESVHTSEVRYPNSCCHRRLPAVSHQPTTHNTAPLTHT